MLHKLANEMKNKSCIVIVGPTATGKTALAIYLASHFKTQIISADSRQCYTELNIGVAKPSPAELLAVKHYFINSHSVAAPVTAGLFEEYACNAAREIFSGNDVAVMVGGTGLYINAFCHGIDTMPPVNESIRKNILSDFEKFGLPWLQKEVEQKDPVYFRRGEIQNPRRLIRALEVSISSGQSITQYQTRKKKDRDFNIIKIGMGLPKEVLYQNISGRVDAMMQQGLLEEVRSLIPLKHYNALQTVGYTEIFDHLLAGISLQQAIENIKVNTRRYAKRQMTWFRKDKEVRWIHAMHDAEKQAMLLIDSCMANITTSTRPLR